ncbi:MAG: hypothetical protein WDO56_00150 [Gammaproteobacteria bacterium]
MVAVRKLVSRFVERDEAGASFVSKFFRAFAPAPDDPQDASRKRLRSRWKTKNFVKLKL